VYRHEVRHPGPLAAASRLKVTQEANPIQNLQRGHG
jgi:hypothetical protein